MVYTKHLTIHKLSHLGNATGYVEDALKTLVDRNEVASHLDNIFPYIMNDDKTINRQLVSGYNISDVYNAEQEFIHTKELAANQKGDNYEVNIETGELVFNRQSLENKNAVLGHHLIQSFSPEDNLTPEEIHEIGRKTVLEMTGGEYEFVIATHVDKGHLHNHIIVNSTNLVSGKQMDWKVVRYKNGKTKDKTFEAFQKISDRIAEKAGAKIIEPTLGNTHQKYTKWQTESIYKSQIKQRLDYLLINSSDINDFKLKAQALNLEFDFSGKWATYRLLDEPQVKNTRARSLDKKDPEKYNVENIIKRLEENANTNISVDEVVQNYDEKITTQKNDFDYQIVLDDWQVDEVTKRGIYINVDFGVGQSGQLFVPGFKVDELDGGKFALYIKQKDFFYFMDNKEVDKNKYMTGSSLVKQLSLYNGTVPLRKEPVISEINEVVNAINFLADHGVSDGTQIDNLNNQLKTAVEKAQDKMDELDDKIIELNQLAKDVLEGNSGDRSIIKIEDELEASRSSRNVLKDKLNETIKDWNYFNEINAEAKERDVEVKQDKDLDNLNLR